MATNVPDVVQLYRQAKGNPYVNFKGPTINIPANGQIPTESLPMRQGMHLLALEVRITANITSTTTNSFTDALMTELFEDLTFRDESGKKIQFWADSHVLKNWIVASNDELIVTPVANLRSSSTATNYREKFFIPLCFLAGSGRYYTMNIETGNLANLLNTSTCTTYNSGTLDIAYIYTDHPLIPFKADSHTINGNAGSNDWQQNCTEGPTPIFVFHSDNDTLWDEYHPYQATFGGNTNIDDVDMLSADGVQKNCDGWTIFEEYKELWLNEFRTFHPIMNEPSTSAFFDTIKKNQGHYTNDLIITFDPPFYSARNVRMRFELLTGDNALHYAQILVNQASAEQPGSAPSVPLATDGGSVMYPTDSRVENVPASQMISDVRKPRGRTVTSRRKLSLSR